MKEFNLSEKLSKPYEVDIGEYTCYIDVHDVKEFIKRLKEETLKNNTYPTKTYSEFCKIIDKLVGEKLK